MLSNILNQVCYSQFSQAQDPNNWCRPQGLILVKLLGKRWSCRHKIKIWNLSQGEELLKVASNSYLASLLKEFFEYKENIYLVKKVTLYSISTNNYT